MSLEQARVVFGKDEESHKVRDEIIAVSERKKVNVDTYEFSKYPYVPMLPKFLLNFQTLIVILSRESLHAIFEGPFKKEFIEEICFYGGKIYHIWVGDLDAGTVMMYSTLLSRSDQKFRIIHGNLFVNMNTKWIEQLFDEMRAPKFERNGLAVCVQENGGSYLDDKNQSSNIPNSNSTTNKVMTEDPDFGNKLKSISIEKSSSNEKPIDLINKPNRRINDAIRTVGFINADSPSSSGSSSVAGASAGASEGTSVSLTADIEETLEMDGDQSQSKKKKKGKKKRK